MSELIASLQQSNLPPAALQSLSQIAQQYQGQQPQVPPSGPNSGAPQVPAPYASGSGSYNPYAATGIGANQ
jgi:hypothetical protein